MAAPNIVNVVTITGKTVGAALGTTLTTSLLANSASSGKVFKINAIIVANVDGTNAADVTVEVSTDNGSSYVKIANTISVPADSSLSLIGKDNGFYLDETDLLAVTASANSDLTYLVSYELMKDA